MGGKLSHISKTPENVFWCVCECDACARLKLVAHLSLDARSLALIVRYCNVHDPVFKDRSQRVRTSDF